MNNDPSSLSFGDLVFVNGECPVTDENRLVVAQRLTISLRTFLSEWFLDVNYGVPYWERILGKKTTKNTVDRILQTEILKVQGVLEITEFNSTLSRSREYSMSFRVRTNRNQETDLINIPGVII